jgi:hypothetical protein
MLEYTDVHKSVPVFRTRPAVSCAFRCFAWFVTVNKSLRCFFSQNGPLDHDA